MKPRPALHKILASMDALVQIDAPTVCHRAKAVQRKSEAEMLSADLAHARDLVALCAANPRHVAWMRDRTEVAPVSAIHSAARQIAEEGAE